MSAALGASGAACDARSPSAHEWIAAEHASYAAVTAAVTDPILTRSAGRTWWIAFGVSAAAVLVMLIAIAVLFTRGIGIWGVNTTVVWGYAIASYVWWIAVGSGGTLISSILVLTRQDWRRSVNRFAESMTLFAVSIAGLFPDPASRPAAVFLLARALSEHHAAVAAVALGPGVGFLGHPQLPSVLDRVLLRRPYPRPRDDARPLPFGLGAHALRSVRARLARLGPALATPRNPPSDVGGARRAARYLGAFDRRPRLRGEPDARLAGEHLSALLRHRRPVLRLRLRDHSDGAGPLGLGLQAVITVNHFDAMAKIVLAASIIMSFSYATEWFMAWYGGRRRSTAPWCRSSSPARTRRSTGPCSSATA